MCTLYDTYCSFFAISIPAVKILICHPRSCLQNLDYTSPAQDKKKSEHLKAAEARASLEGKDHMVTFEADELVK